jgi:hypothetical protein
MRKSQLPGDSVGVSAISETFPLVDCYLSILKIKAMDNKDNVGRPDRDRININENYEVEYWTKTLGISAEQLKNAVKTAGTSTEAVKEHLKK